MLSNKWTFSLLSFVTLLAFGLAFVVPSAMASGDKKKTHVDIDVKIRAAENMIDVDYRGGDNDIQIATGRDRADRAYTAGDGLIITLLVEFSHQVELQGPELVVGDVADPAVDVRSYHFFGADDIYVRAFDRDGRSLGQISLDKVVTTSESVIGFQDARLPGRQFLVRVDESKLTAAYRTELRTPSDAGLEIASVFFFIPQGESATSDANLAKTAIHDLHNAAVATGIRRADIDHVTAHLAPEAHQHINKASNVFRVDLVDDDEGDPQYAKIDSYTTATDVTSGIPGVVSIMRTASRTGFIESGEFEVRIILTEEPKGDDGLTTNHLMVENGKAVEVVKGLTYKGGHPTYDIAAVVVTDELTIPAVTVPERMSELGPAMVMYYHAAGDAAAAVPGTNPIPNTTTTDDTPNDGTVDNFPLATGRDNMYHSYIATIQPDAGHTGTVTVSVKQFDDNVIPLANTYVPLTRQQRHAINLTGAAMHVRDARIQNETLTVQVNVENTKSDAAKKGYDDRQKVLDGVANEWVLPNKTHIPAGGYLVAHVGDLGNTGITDPKSKTKDKISAASKLYNTTKLGLPFPANDLDNFFRNGGTLNLAYADITAATGSGHGDSKGPTGDDATGYTAATTNAYTAGALIINEIMWGLDGDATDSQYIELYNPGTAAIGIDNKEWVITVGAPPTGYTVIDSVSNTPASGYWAVPGQGGLTQSVQEAQDAAGVTTGVAVVAVKDLISMSRIKDTTDGTAAASWAASMRPSSNLSGRRIGTPGAANKYVEPTAPPPPPEPTPPAKAPVATGADIMITEIMVASNEGRLPQWIELANVSGAAVSLMGWSIGVANDSSDADVVGENVNVELGDVTVGKDQVVLVVTKTGRNSGVGMGKGDLREDRIVDVQSQVSPNDARYSLISEMAFKLTLLPPQTGGVVEPGDVAGNLNMGWELPMAEGDRSSLIRREMSGATEIMGTDAAGWVLASETSLIGAYRPTYYGDDEDQGTPGYDAGGALPVELSKFGAKRDALTGQVVITWETQSELNNAGFFIKRSQQKNGQFVAVNPTMVAGAGTTSEKQTYTYTDTTAQPNIVYYYQIEDVSLDGNRQTLTRAHRLKGHIGAAGKLTTLWGELKEQK